LKIVLLVKKNVYHISSNKRCDVYYKIKFLGAAFNRKILIKEEFVDRKQVQLYLVWSVF